jgi:hypothetical protein
VPKGMLLVQSRPADPAREDEFNDWYTHTHIPEVCAVPGVVAAQRYKVHDPGRDGDDAGSVYVAVYEIDSDDLEAPMRELVARSGDGRVRMSELLQMDPPPVVTLCERIG